MPQTHLLKSFSVFFRQSKGFTCHTENIGLHRIKCKQVSVRLRKSKKVSGAIPDKYPLALWDGIDFGKRIFFRRRDEVFYPPINRTASRQFAGAGPPWL